MSQEFTPNNQAERLRKKIEKIKEEGIGVETNALPSRTDIHRNKKNKTKWKIKFPVIRLLVLFFILLPVVIISAYNSLGTKTLKSSETVTTPNNVGYEKINLDVNKEGEITGKTEDEEVLQPDSIPNEHNNEPILTTPLPGENTEVELNGSNISKENNLGEGSKEVPTTQINQEKTTNAQNITYHTVKANENLFRIAMKYYHSQKGIEIIQQANNLHGNEIKVGQVLKIPQ